MEHLDQIRTEEQKISAAKNRAFWGSYFANKPRHTAADIALRIANAKVAYGAENADDWLKKAQAAKKRESLFRYAP